MAEAPSAAPHRTHAASSVGLLGKILGVVRREEVPTPEHGGTMHLGVISPSASKPDIADSASPSDAVLTLNALCDRYADASPGDVIVYHIGLLARDRDKLASSLVPDVRAELDRVADRVWAMAAHGLVHLLQRRVAPGRLAYLAVARPRPRSPTRQRAA